MPLRRLFTPRGWSLLAMAAAFTIAAVVLSAPMLGHVALLCLLLIAGGLIATVVTPVRGEVSRTISTDLLTVGEVSEVHVHLRPRGRLARFARWRDTLPDAIAGEAIGSVSPREGGLDLRPSIPLTYAVHGMRRGEWTLGPLILRTNDPFGLVNRDHTVGGTRQVTVVPRLLPVPDLGVLHGAAGGTAHTVSSRLGQGADNLSPRRYVPGDSMRRVHWRATAHRGDLMVRQEEEEDSPDALVVLDLHPARWSPPGGAADPLFERAVGVCAATALHLASAGYTVSVTDDSGTPLGLLHGNEEDRDELLVALARTNPRGGPTGERTPARLDLSPQGPFVIVTGRIESAARQLPRRPSAVTAVLLAADPQPGVLEALRARGWNAERIDEGGTDA